MDHRREQSKLDQVDDCSENKDQPSYYYDDATNYETYRDDDEEDDESLSQKNNVQD
jgi:hypothetical protein